MEKRFFSLMLMAVCFFCTPTLAFGDKPVWDEQGNLVQQEEEALAEEPVVEEAPPEPEIPDEDLERLRKTYRRAIEQKNFSEALETLDQIPQRYYTPQEGWAYQTLLAISQIDGASKQQSNAIFGEGDLDEATKKTVKRLHKEAQYALVTGQRELGRDLLIQVLYNSRRDFKAKALLKDILGLRSGDYKVENMETKYWRQSETYFYGGSYESASEVLSTLTVFDNDNWEVYERLGSNYYMMGENKKAIDAWTTALFLSPGNKDLEHVIEKTKTIVEEQKAEARARRKKKKEAKKPAEVSGEETQLLGVFPTQTKAYSYAQRLREQGLTALVDELDNGKWAVRVPKSQISKEKK